MAIPEGERVRLSEQLFTLVCPQCKTPIQTEYSKWDIQLLSEHASEGVDISCNHCSQDFIYTPSSHSVTKK